MGYPRKSQTVTATPAKPGELSILLERPFNISCASLSWTPEGYVLRPRSPIPRPKAIQLPVTSGTGDVVEHRRAGLPISLLQRQVVKRRAVNA